METAMASPAWLRSTLIGIHAAAAVWFMVNGVGHQLHVMYKLHAGTLRNTHTGSLLAIGAGLMIVGALLSWSLAHVVDAAPGYGLAWVAVAGAAAMLVAIDRVYGATFLSGSIFFTALDALALLALMVASRPPAA